MSPAVEIRGLDRLRKRFAALGAMKGLHPVLRAEAEAVAAEAKTRLTERDPDSSLARSIKIMELKAGDQPAYTVGTDDPAGIFPRIRHQPEPRLALACPSFARSFTWN